MGKSLEEMLVNSLKEEDHEWDYEFTESNQYKTHRYQTKIPVEGKKYNVEVEYTDAKNENGSAFGFGGSYKLRIHDKGEELVTYRNEKVKSLFESLNGNDYESEYLKEKSVEQEVEDFYKEDFSFGV